MSAPHGHDAPHDHGEHGGHGHGHGSQFIQHHYDDAQHQFDSGKFGIWLFLAQEVLFFSALFVAYILYRHHHPEIYAYAHKYLDVTMGAINTAVLIFSSLTAAWAVRCAQLSQRRGLILCIALTIACALGFLVIKYFEYTHKIHEHILFGGRFDPCVSSGGRPLMTKNNECPGSETSVIWDAAAARPIEGCFDAATFDHNPLRDGIQADCKVFEAKGAFQKKQDPKTKQDVLVWVEQKRTPIATACPEWKPGHGTHGPPGTKFPCWRPAVQPAVCNVGWTFHWQCTGACAPADGSGSSGPYESERECQKASEKRKKDLDAAGGQTTVSACIRGNTLGFLVEYNDHDVRSDIRIEAECKPRPPEPPILDPLADRVQPIELGKPAVSSTPRSTKPSEHDLKEANYAGPPPENTNMFFTIYFAMTGLHGIHVLFGVFVFIWLLIRSIKGHFTPDYFGPIDFAALYWHIVDLIWIFLFPLLYLIH